MDKSVKHFQTWLTWHKSPILFGSLGVSTFPLPLLGLSGQIHKVFAGSRQSKQILLALRRKNILHCFWFMILKQIRPWSILKHEQLLTQQGGYSHRRWSSLSWSQPVYLWLGILDSWEDCSAKHGAGLRGLSDPRHLVGVHWAEATLIQGAFPFEFACAHSNPRKVSTDFTSFPKKTLSYDVEGFLSLYVVLEWLGSCLVHHISCRFLSKNLEQNLHGAYLHCCSV